MESEIDSLFSCESLLTDLKANAFEATQLLLDDSEQKQLQQQYERLVLIPFLQKHSHFPLFTKATQGNAEAQFQLGMQKKDQKWLEKAANQGHVEALYQLGIQNKDIYNLILAAAYNHILAQFQVGTYYENKKDIQNAVYWYQKAADQNHIESLEKYCQCLYKSITINDHDMINQGIQYAEKGYALGSMQCWNSLALFYKLQHRYSESFAILSQLVLLPNVAHNWQYNYGMCFEYGQGTEINLQTAQEWYEKAKQNGSQVAIQALEQIKFQNKT